MRSTIVIVRSSVGLPLHVALQAGGASACVLTATSLVSTQPSLPSPTPSAPLRHFLRPLCSFLGAERHRLGLPATAVSDERPALSP